MAKLPENHPPLSSGRSSFRLPRLPLLGLTDATSLRHEVNPAIALTLLSEIQQGILDYQKELRTLVHQIKAIYAEGPVVNGWLESAQHQTSSPSTETHSALFRHADVDDLMAYIQSLDAAPAVAIRPVNGDPQYRLCMIDQMGKVQSRPCPPEQVPAVSMAIARHQKLQQIVTRKQHIEQQLQSVVDTLSNAKAQLGRT